MKQRWKRQAVASGRSGLLEIDLWRDGAQTVGGELVKLSEGKILQSIFWQSDSHLCILGIHWLLRIQKQKQIFLNFRPHSIECSPPKPTPASKAQNVTIKTAEQARMKPIAMHDIQHGHVDILKLVLIPCFFFLSRHSNGQSVILKRMSRFFDQQRFLALVSLNTLVPLQAMAKELQPCVIQLVWWAVGFVWVLCRHVLGSKWILSMDF